MSPSPVSRSDVERLLPHFNYCGKEAFIYILEDELERMFGNVGIFMVRKHLQEYKKKGSIDPRDVPIIIDKICETVETMVGKETAGELKNRLKVRCSLTT